MGGLEAPIRGLVEDRGRTIVVGVKRKREEMMKIKKMMVMMKEMGGSKDQAVSLRK